jgi:DNA-binding protein YbaB
MFEMFGDMEQKQRELQEKLAEIIIDHSSDDQEIVVKINANKEIKDITVAPELLAEDQAEKLQDMLVVTINEAIRKAETKAMEEMQNQLGDILPDMGSFGSPFTA